MRIKTREGFSKKLLIVASITLLIFSFWHRFQSSPSQLLFPKESIAISNFLKLPLFFERNDGQTDLSVDYLVRANGYTLFFMPQKIAMLLQETTSTPTNDLHPVMLEMKFIGSNSLAHPEGIETLPGKSHYIVNADSEKWHTNVEQFAKIRYQNLYPGVDAIFYGDQQKLEYDINVAPGADPKKIIFSVSGAKKIIIDNDGHLVLSAFQNTKIVMKKPEIYQLVQGVKQPVKGAFVIHDKNQIAFSIGHYDEAKTLVIDPGIVYSTSFASEGSAVGNSITIDAKGNAYVTGQTTSAMFPKTSKAFQTTLSEKANNNAFIVKLNSQGELLYSTYLGGDGNEAGNAIAVNSQGNVYVTGQTTSANFPTTSNAFQTSVNTSSLHAFIAELDAEGKTLIYSTYLSGSSSELGKGIAIDSIGNAYVTGETTSVDFPITAGAFQTSFTSGATSQAFISQLNSTGSHLVYSTYLGGAGHDAGNAITINKLNHVYVTGETTSVDFPITAGAFQTSFTPGATSQAFIAQLSSSGSDLVYSTYLGGAASDVGKGIVINSSGHVYVTGKTTSANFPITEGAFQTSLAKRAVSNAFVTQLNSSGNRLIYSTYLGGESTDAGYSIAIDSSGNTYVTGQTSSANFPITEKTDQNISVAGLSRAFIAKLNADGHGLFYSSLVGGETSSIGKSIAIDSSGNAYLTGASITNSIPEISGLQIPLVIGSTENVFVTKVAS